jgi:hypothetical protein
VPAVGCTVLPAVGCTVLPALSLVLPALAGVVGAEARPAGLSSTSGAVLPAVDGSASLGGFDEQAVEAAKHPITLEIAINLDNTLNSSCCAARSSPAFGSAVCGWPATGSQNCTREWSLYPHRTGCRAEFALRLTAPSTFST